MDINKQKSLTSGKGWKFVKEYGKGKKAQITTRIKNIVGGLKASPKFIMLRVVE